MRAEEARHNNKILRTEAEAPPPSRCNCQAALRPSCPLPGYSTVTCVVYKATVTSGNSNDPQSQNIETYTGLTEPRGKKRFKKHYDDIKKYIPRDPENHKSGTRLSWYCGGLEAFNIPYNIQ